MDRDSDDWFGGRFGQTRTRFKVMYAKSEPAFVYIVKPNIYIYI